jgi:coenzyme F420-reducing hydrogenase alpha subunit
MIGGRFVSSSGMDAGIKEYEFCFEERHVQHSNALHGYQKGRGAYCVGPLARFNLNFDRLPPLVQQVAHDAGAVPPVKNQFKSIVVRSLETIFAYEEALRIIESYEPPPKPAVEVHAVSGIGFGATEAPRGTLYHRYRISDEELILDARIVPPTAQNQPTIENDVKKFVESHMDLPREVLTWKTEQAVRNYDPCISCATHFLRWT